MSFCSWDGGEKYRNHFEAGINFILFFCRKPYYFLSLSSNAMINGDREYVIRFDYANKCSDEI